MEKNKNATRRRGKTTYLLIYFKRIVRGIWNCTSIVPFQWGKTLMLLYSLAYKICGVNVNSEQKRNQLGNGGKKCKQKREYHKNTEYIYK